MEAADLLSLLSWAALDFFFQVDKSQRSSCPVELQVTLVSTSLQEKQLLYKFLVQTGLFHLLSLRVCYLETAALIKSEIYFQKF